MNHAITQSLYVQKKKQTGLFLVLLCASLVINMLQGIERLTVTEKVVVLPPDIKKDIWIKGNAVSEGYLEEWGLYLTNLLLNVSATTMRYQSELALRHVSPDFSGKLKLQFKKDEEALKKNNATTTFLPKEIVVHEKDMTVHITGTFASYIGKERVSAHEHTYELKFIFNKGRFLQLTHFKHIRNGQAPVEDDTDTAETLLNLNQSLSEKE